MMSLHLSTTSCSGWSLFISTARSTTVMMKIAIGIFLVMVMLLIRPAIGTISGVLLLLLWQQCADGRGIAGRSVSFSATLPLLTVSMLMEWWLTTVVELLPFTARCSITADTSFAIIPSDISVVVLLTETAATSGLDSSSAYATMLLMLLSR
uniref:Uncharacterized protein n=1 Tax=Anopheles darlingi TaxID=43151 RepID=A0A2M4D5R3_ANODA